MPRVTKSTAAKDYPEHSIAKGDTYYHWSFFRGPKQFSKTVPKQSQLCNTVLSGAYAASENLGEELTQCDTPEAIADALDTAADEASSVIDELEEQISNMEDAFQGGSPMIDEKTEQKDALESWKDELESARDTIRDLSVEDYIDRDERRDAIRLELADNLEEGQTLTDEAVEEALDKALEAVKEFDDLTEAEQASMLDAAMDEANSPDLGI